MAAAHSTSVPGVLYALDASGAVATPEGVSPQEHYRCLACDEPVSPVRAHTRQVGRDKERLRTVTVKAHFSHRKDSHCTASGESVLHLACKTWIRQSLDQHRGLSVQMICQNCAEPAVFVHGLGPDDQAETEVRIGEYRADVAVTGESSLPEFVVEVRFTHQVSECKALGLQVPWVEVQASPELLIHPERPLTLMALNTNLFFHQPCECGNDASSYPRAQEWRKQRLEAEHQAWLEAQERQRQALHAAYLAQSQQHRLDAAARRQEREAELARARRSREEREAALLRVRAHVEAFLDQHVPDVRRRLPMYVCVLTACPGCGIMTVFFDSSGMNMVPTWSPVVMRRTPDHPWEAVCLTCGWHGQAPKNGERISFQAGDRRAAPASRFWWQEDH